MQRMGIVPPRVIEGRCQSVMQDLANMDPSEARRAKRKYRKVWRRSLARELREFECTPRRRRDQWAWGGAYVKGVWESCEDPLGGMLLKLVAVDVGKRPSRYARWDRWQRVKASQEFRKTLLEVAIELGLIAKRST